MSDYPSTTRDILEPPGRMVAYFPSMAEITGSVKAAILLQQIKWNTSRDRRNDGWIQKSVTEWREETGLSEREFRESYSLLLKENLADRRYDRLNHQLYLRLNVDEYNKRIRELPQPLDFEPNDKTSFGERQNVISPNDKTSFRLNVVKNLETTEIETKKTLSSKPSVSDAHVSELIDDWNKIPGSEGLPKVTDRGSKNPTLRHKIRLRLQEHPDDEFWTRVLNNCWKSPFLRGEKGDWKVSLHWLVKNDYNAIQVYEGHYNATR